MSDGEIGSLYVRLLGDDSELRKTLAGAADRLQQAGSQMQSAGRSLTLGVTAPIVGAGGAAIAFATNFNSGMANVASLGSEAAAAVEGWAPAVQTMAVDVGKSTSDLTAGLYQVVSAFGAGEDTMLHLETNARAAAAGLATTEEAVALTSAVTKGYGDTSAEAVQQAADLALMTVQLGQTTFPELAASMGRVVPIAANLGLSQEEMFAAMATATGVTGNAAEVSTQLRGVLQSLMAPTEGMSQLMADLGYENGEAMLSSLGLQGTLDAVAQAAASSGQPLQEYLSSIEAQTLALALSGPQADVYAEKLAAMSEASGAVDEAFKAQTEGVNAAGFAYTQAKIAMENTAIQVGQQLMPAFTAILNAVRPLIAWIGGLAEKFAALSPQQQGVILALVGIAAAIGPVLVVLGTIVSSVGTLIGAWGSLTALFAGTAGPLAGVAAVLTGPVGLAIAAVIVAVALLYAAWQTNFGGIRDFAAEVWASIMLAFDAFKLLFQGDWEGFLDLIKQAHAMAWQAVVDFLGRLWDMVRPKLEALWTSLSTWWNSIDWGALGRSIIDGIIRGITNGITAIADAARNAAQAALDAAKNWLGINSPSLVFRNEVGFQMAAGVALGISDGLPMVQAEIAGMASMPRMDFAGGAAVGAQSSVNTYNITVPDERTAHLLAAMLRRERDERWRVVRR